jgi:trigger factor
MNHSIEKISETRAKVTVTVSGEESAAQDRAALRNVSQQARVPGFRPGKAPEALLRQRYAKAIAEEGKHKTLSAAYEYARDKSGLKIFTLVDAVEGDIVPGKEAAPVFTFDLVPEITLPKYIGLETKVRPVILDDKDIDDNIEAIRRSKAKYEKVEREVRKGDYVKLSYKGAIDGTPIEGMTDKKIWGTQENTWEEAGEAGPNTLGVPAIVEGIVGMKIDEEKDLDQVFEENHEVEALRGKKAVYHVTIHEVRERVLPAMDDEFLKDLKVESVEKLRERLKEELTNRKNYERRMSQREQIVRKLLDEVKFEVPESAVESETQNVLQRVMVDNMRRGVPKEEFEAHKDEMHAKAQEIAHLQTLRNFLITEIAKAEKIQVTNDDMSRAITMQAMRMRITPDQFVKELTKDRDAVRGMQRDILLDKTMEFLADKATVVESADAPEGDEHDHSGDEGAKV